jgi:hypothetical protein
MFHYGKIGWLQLALQFNFATTLQLNVFLWHECYWTSCMSCNGHNPLYVEPYTYATCAT